MPGKICFEGATALADQVVAHERGARGCSLGLSREARTFDGPQGRAHLGFRGWLGQLLDRLSVAVPAQKIHARVDASGIAPQDAFD